MPDLEIFGLEFENNIVIFEISTLEFVQLPNIMEKQQCLNLEPNMPDLGIFDQICLTWVFLGKNIKNTIVRFLISTLKFVYLQNLREKLKCLNLEPEMADLEVLELEFEKGIVIFEINALECV